MTGLLILAAIVVAVWGARFLLRHLIGRRSAVTNRARNLRWRARLRLRLGQGYASMAELIWCWSRTRAVLGHGKRGRPGVPLRARILIPVTAIAVRYGRAQWGKRVFGRLEDQVLIMGPPRSGKSASLMDRMIDHPGPVLATSTRPDLVTTTAHLRSLLGPVHVFNPQGIGNGILSTFAWNILHGCEDPAVAFRRAAGLIGGVRKEGDMGFWLDKATAALAALLHAGALGGRTILDVYEWTNRHGDEAANEILARDPRGSRILLSTLAEIQRGGSSGRGPAESMRMTISRSLAWVAIPAIAKAATGSGAGAFDIEEFVRSNGTLYLLAQDAEDSPIAPLFRAFACEVHYIAGLVGSQGLAGKLDPPVLFALDEVAQIAPVPLPEWLSDSAGKGILIAAVAHDRSQLAGRWGDDGAKTIWATCGVKILFGGSQSTDTLDYISGLCGTIDIKDGDGRQTVPVLPSVVLEHLPDWRALILRMNLHPVVVKVRRPWKRRIVKRAPRYAPRPVFRPAVVPSVQEHGAPARLAEFTTELPAPQPAPKVNGVNGHSHGHATGDDRPPQWLRDDNGR